MTGIIQKANHTKDSALVAGGVVAEMGWAIALHGGAGDISRSMPPERREPREAALRHCLQVGVAAIKAGRSPLDVVELVVSTIHLHLVVFCF